MVSPNAIIVMVIGIIAILAAIGGGIVYFVFIRKDDGPECKLPTCGKTG